MNEERIRQIAIQRYNHPNDKPVPAELRRQIERTTITESTIPAESSLNRPPGMSRHDWYRQQDAMRHEAELVDKLRAEREAEQVPESLKAKQQLLDLAESRARMAPGSKKAHFERLASERREQLNEHKQELAEQQRQADRRAIVEGNERFKSALENANAEFRLSASDEQRQNMLFQLRHDLQKAQPEDVDSIVDRYWECMKSVYDRDALNEMDNVVEADKQAADAVNKSTDANQRLLATQHRSNMTKFE